MWVWLLWNYNMNQRGLLMSSWSRWVKSRAFICVCDPLQLWTKARGKTTFTFPAVTPVPSSCVGTLSTAPRAASSSSTPKSTSASTRRQIRPNLSCCRETARMIKVWGCWLRGLSRSRLRAQCGCPGSSVSKRETTSASLSLTIFWKRAPTGEPISFANSPGLQDLSLWRREES